MRTLTEKVKEAVYQQTTFLSGLEEPELEELLTRSKWDRRVRNVTPLYALFYKRDKWHKLMRNSTDAFSLQLQFSKALLTLEKRNPEVSFVAKDLKQMFFKNGKMYVLANRKDSSEEMAKLLQSLVRGVRLEESLSDSTRKSVETKLKKVDVNNLFKSNKRTLRA